VNNDQYLDETNKRYSEAVCSNYKKLLFQHGPSRFLPDSAEDLKWQRERDELCAKAHKLALADISINRRRKHDVSG
jgi:hypothetical protein